MEHRFTRTEALLSEAAVHRLSEARVAVFGLGGVGGHAVDALARCGVGALDLVDADTVSITNINRQMFALTSTVGRPKVEVAAERIHDINPACHVRTYELFFDKDTLDRFDFSAYDYVVDSIDSVSSKLLLIEQARAADVPILCSMGMGNKLDPTALAVMDIEKTTVCPLARVMRRELRLRGIRHVKVVSSTEPPRAGGTRGAPASYACVPATAGLILASEVVRDLCAAWLSETV